MLTTAKTSTHQVQTIRLHSIINDDHMKVQHYHKRSGIGQIVANLCLIHVLG